MKKRKSKEKGVFLCYFTRLQYLWIRYAALGKAKKNEFFFAISLVCIIFAMYKQLI